MSDFRKELVSILIALMIEVLNYSGCGGGVGADSSHVGKRSAPARLKDRTRVLG